MANIAIIGTGAFGTALANVLLENKNNNVYMFGKDPTEINDLKNVCNTRYYGNNKLTRAPIFVCDDLNLIFKNNIEFVLLAVPSSVIVPLLKTIEGIVKNKKIIYINVIKGISEDGSLWNKVFEKNIKNNYVVYLYGPTFANEVFNKEKSCANIISKNKLAANKVAKLFKTSFFTPIISNNLIEAQVCSCYKNIYAIGMGIIDEKYNHSCNTTAVFFNQLINEICFMIKNIYKANINEIFNVSCIGDIFLTCTSTKSRNFTFGNELVKGTAQIGKYTVEGLNALKNSKDTIVKYKKQLPFINAIYSACYENKKDLDFFKLINGKNL